MTNPKQKAKQNRVQRNARNTTNINGKRLFHREERLAEQFYRWFAQA